MFCNLFYPIFLAICNWCRSFFFLAIVQVVIICFSLLHVFHHNMFHRMLLNSVPVWCSLLCQEWTVEYVAGNKGVIRHEDLEAMKSGCILCNMGHPSMEIDVVRIRLTFFLFAFTQSNSRLDRVVSCCFFEHFSGPVCRLFGAVCWFQWSSVTLNWRIVTPKFAIRSAALRVVSPLRVRPTGIRKLIFGPRRRWK